MTVEPTSGWLDCPALLAGRAPARTRTSLCSDMRAFPARPAAMLGVMRRRGSSLNTAILGLRSGGFEIALRASLLAQTRYNCPFSAPLRLRGGPPGGISRE